MSILDGYAASAGHVIEFQATDTLEFYAWGTGATAMDLITTQVFRDPSAWYHIVYAVDTTQLVGSNRIKLYVNGVQVTTFSTATYPAQNSSLYIDNNIVHNIGRRGDAQFYFDGYLTEVNFIDGQALTPSSFGGYNPGTGVWEPRQYTGTYGTNGFYLPFTNNASLEALGYDSSISSPELITNGMFVTNVTGWTVTPGTGGSPSITWQSAHTARLANINAFGATYYQAIPTVVGQTYYAQCYASNISLGGATRNAQLLKGDNSNFSTNLVVLGSVPQSSGAGGIRNTFVATATTTYIGIQADVGGTSGSADFTQVSVALGGYKDSWNPFGVSLTAGTTYDSMLDVPTNTSNTNANFAVLNPIVPTGAAVISGGNLNIISTTVYCNGLSTISLGSGAYYAECVVNTHAAEGWGVWDITKTAAVNTGTVPSGFYGIYSGGATLCSNGSSLGTNVAGTPANGDIMQVAWSNGNVWIGKNNTWYNSSFGTTGNPSTGANPTFTGLTVGQFSFIFGTGNAAASLSANFGQRPFSYTPPSGFKSLNTYNLPDPAITKPVSVHNLYTYTGNGGGQQIGEIQKPMSLFNLDRSLRFRGSASAYLNKTPASASNRKTWTWSGWVKRGQLNPASYNALFSSATNGSNTDLSCLRFSTDTLQFFAANGTNSAVTTSVFRDTSLWYHIVAVLNTTGVANGFTLYINGVQQSLTYTSFTADLQPSINNTVPHNIGAQLDSGSGRLFYFDGYLADVYFIDGQALAPTDFGTYDGNYYWTPKAYTGTYGTNGFHLEFEDFSAATAAAIGKDTSGNGNNWTPNNINLTTPANTNTSWDSMTDVPTLTSTDTADYCTLDPLTASVPSTIKDGNLQITGTMTGTAMAVVGNMPVSAGKWYWECIPNGTNSTGIAGIITSSVVLTTAVGAGWLTGQNYYFYFQNGNKSINGTSSAYGATFTTNDIIGVALDLDVGTLTFYKNGVSQGVAATGITGAYVPFTYDSSAGSCSINWAFNFGQRGLKYPVTGYKALNSYNIAEVTGDLESPDFVWIKSRSASGDHALFNSVTGVGKYLRSNSNLPVATDVNSLIQFNKNGFLLGNSTAANTLSTTYIAAAWKMSATTATNNNGNVSSQVRANTNAGISIATFTTPASGNFTVGHGLGKIPSMFILKTTSGTDNFYVYNKNFDTPTTYYLQLNSGSVILSSASLWGSTNPTLDVVTLGVGGGIAANATGIIYSFTDIEGFSKFGKYISNNDPNGPFVYTGFRPRWLIVKRAVVTAGSTGGWFMYDAARNTYNVMDKYLFAEGTAGENTLAVFDFTANGFKIRSNNVHVNTTAGDTYIYMAFAEAPFKFALARQLYGKEKNKYR